MSLLNEERTPFIFPDKNFLLISRAPLLGRSWTRSLALEKFELLVNGLPTSAIHPFYSENKERVIGYFKESVPMVSLTKGH